MTLQSQDTLYRAVPGQPVWIDIGGHDCIGWWSRKAAEVAHIPGCGLQCPLRCGPASELLGIAGVRARFRGDLIVPHEGHTLSLRDVLSLVASGVGASCDTIVVDDLAAITAQRPTRVWWRDLAEAANASTADGVRVLLLAAPQDLEPWPEGLPPATWVRRDDGWWLGGHFGAACEVAR